MPLRSLLVTLLIACCLLVNATPTRAQEPAPEQLQTEQIEADSHRNPEIRLYIVIERTADTDDRSSPYTNFNFLVKIDTANQ